MRKFLLSLAVLVLIIPVLGFAAEVKTAELVSKNETPKNLYLAGQNPTVDANVTGDLVVAGSVVTVNGDVSNGVLAAGGTLNLNGNVANNVRVAGGTVNIEGNIGGDLVIFGGNVILGTKSVVSGDVIVFAGTLDLKGSVLGSVKNTYAGDVIIVGNVSGNVQLNQVGTLKLESSAVIGGNLQYSSTTEAVVASDAKVGGNVEYTKVTQSNVQGESLGSKFMGMLFGAVMSFVALLVFISLLPKFATNATNSAIVNPLAKLGIGFLAIVVTPIALLLLLITFIGWGVMGYLFMIYMAFFALTGSLSALLVGSLVWKFIKKEKDLIVNWKTAGIGVVVMAIFKLIPVVGWLAAFVVAMIVFGTLTIMSFDFIKAQRA